MRVQEALKLLDELVHQGNANSAMCRVVLVAAMRQGNSLIADAAVAADDATRTHPNFKSPRRSGVDVQRGLRSVDMWAQVVRLEVRWAPH